MKSFSYYFTIFLNVFLTLSSCAFEESERMAPFWVFSGTQTITRNLDNLGWESYSITSDSILFRDIESNGSYELVAVGQDGNIWQSFDMGKRWFDRTSENGNTSRLWEIIYNGKYVAVGNSGIILTSDNGRTWDNRTSGVTKVLRDIAFGNSKYVVVGHNGTVLTSSDSVSWTQQTSPTSSNFFGLDYLNNIFIAVGDNGIIYTSSDGVTWTSKTSGTTEKFKDISYGSGLYVAVATNGKIFTSTDTNTWTSRDSDSESDFWAVEFGDGHFLAGGSDIVKSYDGISWNKILTNVTYGIEYVEYNTKEYEILHNPTKPTTKIMVDVAK